MIRKILLLGIWVGFVAYTLWLAPLDQADTWPLAQKLLTLQWRKLNTIIPSIFVLMGVWPMIFGCLMFADGREQNFRVWPYFIGSNFTGVICLLPYLIIRRRNSSFEGKKDKVLQFFDQRSTGIGLLIVTVITFIGAIASGDWENYVQQFQSRHFVHLISIDFCLMCLVFPLTSLMNDDMGRRGIHWRWLFWAVALVPLFGPLVYLCLRPPLPQNEMAKTIPTSELFLST